MYKTEVYNRAFWDTVKGKSNQTDETILREGITNSGGFTFPDKAGKQFTAALGRDNLFRRLATFTRIPEGSARALAVDSTAEANWVGESTAFPEQEDSFAFHSFKTNKLTSLAKFKKDFIADNAFDLEDYVISHFARRFGRAEERAFLNGNGTTEPCGLLHELNGAQVGVTTAGSQPTFDEVVALYFSLKPEYRSRAVWLMNDETLMHLRTLKDTAGNYLYFDAPRTLLGQPIQVTNHLASATPGAKPILFGDLSYYWVVESAGLSVKILHELYAAQGLVGIAAYEQLDGRLIRPEAVQVLKIGA